MTYDWDEHEEMRNALRKGLLYKRPKYGIKTHFWHLLRDWWFIFGLSLIAWSLFFWWVLR